ncbi:hypothetical protein MATL_G00136480 [Megalops atlanticus]|uniref:Sulfotransferase n=1 Tax=Megalops atlanticus TaxID=7932 RepID=A0A9D3PZM0_MEGAT|nr:hypothetical protein MATL_G00136480 [Megalops atlanticus]
MTEGPPITDIGLITYKGFNLIRNVHEEVHLHKLEKFEIRENDIFIITYPKSGTTWMQYILALMYHSDQLNGEHSKRIMEVVPWIEVWMKRIDYSKMPSPRTFASHLPPNLVPQQLRDRGKVIYIARNPKDVAVSFYYFHNFSKLLEDKPDFDTFLDQYLEGKVFGNSWFDHIQGWYSNKDNFNLLFLTYEEMRKDLRGTLVKVSNFLDKNLDDAMLDMIVEKSSFESMRLCPNANLEHQSPKYFDHSKGAMLRKGKVGDWKRTFTVAQNEKFDKIYKEKMKAPLGFGWDL